MSSLLAAVRRLAGASRAVECDIRSDFFAHLARLPLPYFRRHRTGDLMSRAMSDLEAVRLTIGIALIDAFNTVIVFAVTIVLRQKTERKTECSRHVADCRTP